MAAAKKTTTKKATTDTSFDAMTAMNPESFKEGYEKMAEGVNAMADFQKGYMEAVMASYGAFAKGFEKIATEQTAFAKASFEDSVAIVKEASSAKSIQEVFETNNEFVRIAVEKNLEQTNKVAELWTETAKETVEPLTERYSELVEKIQAYRP